MKTLLRLLLALAIVAFAVYVVAFGDPDRVGRELRTEYCREHRTDFGDPACPK